MKQVSRPTILVDPWGHPLRDPVTGGIVGQPLPVGAARVIWALPDWANGGLRRYRTHPLAETCVYMVDFSLLVRRGVGLTSPELTIWQNLVPPVAADADFTVHVAPAVLHRAIYATIGGGIEGKDYQFRWVVDDTEGNTWARTTLVLVAQTS